MNLKRAFFCRRLHQSTADRVDLRRDVIEPACAAAEKAVAAAEMRLALEVCPGDLSIQGDARILRKVVARLLENAVKHGFPNGRIELTAGKGSNGVTVSIWSEGRAFSVPTRRGPVAWFRGTDPLQGCRRIIRLHGGAVWAKCEKGQWAEIWFTLPQPVATASPHAERKVSA
jgi:signal transduction histidine kinase